MRLIDADELIKDRVENDPVRIAAECAPTAFDKGKVINELNAERNPIYREDGSLMADNRSISINKAISIVKKGRIE